MKLIYEDLALMFPLGYNLKLDNVPAKGNVVVLTEDVRIGYTEELSKEERQLILTSDIQAYIRHKDEEADNRKIISDLISFFNTINEKVGDYIGGYWVWSVDSTGGPNYLGREGENALFSMSLRVRYKIKL